MLSYIFYFIVYPLLLVAAVSFGKKAAHRTQKKNHQWTPLGLESGLVGFYALLTSFTLVQSGNNAHERETMIHTVADDISEILRVSVTNPPDLHARIRLYFSDFYDIIKEPVNADADSIQQRIQKINHMGEAYDAYMQHYILQYPTERDRINTTLSKTDRMESVYYRLLHSYQRTLPKVILLILILFSMFIAFLMGYLERLYENRFPISTIIFVLMSFIIINVIHDLDNPAIGFLQPNFSDIKEVMETFHITSQVP